MEAKYLYHQNIDTVKKEVEQPIQSVYPHNKKRQRPHHGSTALFMPV